MSCGVSLKAAVGRLQPRHPSSSIARTCARYLHAHFRQCLAAAKCKLQRQPQPDSPDESMAKLRLPGSIVSRALRLECLKVMQQLGTLFMSNDMLTSNVDPPAPPQPGIAHAWIARWEQLRQGVAGMHCWACCAAMLWACLIDRRRTVSNSLRVHSSQRQVLRPVGCGVLDAAADVVWRVYQFFLFFIW